MDLEKGTALTRAFAKSKVARYLSNTMTGCIIPLQGCKRLMFDITKEVIFSGWSEAQIKLLLYELLQASDIDKEMYLECKRLLQLAETSLTAAQIEQFYNKLYE